MHNEELETRGVIDTMTEEKEEDLKKLDMQRKKEIEAGIANNKIKRAIKRRLMMMTIKKINQVK